VNIRVFSRKPPNIHSREPLYKNPVLYRGFLSVKSVLHCVIVSQCVAVCCSVLQCVAVCWDFSRVHEESVCAQSVFSNIGLF